LNEGEESEPYKSTASEFTELLTTLQKTQEDVNKFLTAIRSVSYSCAELGSDFQKLSRSGDPISVTRCADAYSSLMVSVYRNFLSMVLKCLLYLLYIHIYIYTCECFQAKIDDSVRKPSDERIVSEVSQSIASKVAEMQVVKSKMDSRINLKREYNHYLGKVRQLKENPSKDPVKLPRNEAKLEEARRFLDVATNDLLQEFDVWIRARPFLLKAEFEALRSAQKQYFSEAASTLKDFVITAPTAPGGGLSVADLAAASGKPKYVPVEKISAPAIQSNTFRTAAPSAEPASTSSNLLDFDDFLSTPNVNRGGYATNIPPAPASYTKRAQQCKAMYAFEARGVDELTFPVGAIVTIEQKNADGKCVACLFHLLLLC
jgi:hypothetical protein